MHLSDKLADWAVRYCRNTPNIALMVAYGSYSNGTLGVRSDMNFFFVPKRGDGQAEACTFCVEQMVFLLHPMSWATLDKIANLAHPLLPAVGNPMLLYWDSDEARICFEGLRHKLRVQLDDEAHIAERARARFDVAAKQGNALLATNQMRQARYHAGKLLQALSEAVAYANHTYFKRGFKTQFDDLQTLRTPEEFCELYRALICADTVPLLQRVAERLLYRTASFLSCSRSIACPAPLALPSVLLSERQKNSACLQLYAVAGKLRSCEISGEAKLAFVQAVHLQQKLDMFLPELLGDVMTVFDSKNLAPTCRVVERLADQAFQRAADEGLSLERWANFESFEVACPPEKRNEWGSQ